MSMRIIMVLLLALTSSAQAQRRPTPPAPAPVPAPAPAPDPADVVVTRFDLMTGVVPAPAGRRPADTVIGTCKLAGHTGPPARWEFKPDECSELVGLAAGASKAGTDFKLT